MHCCITLAIDIIEVQVWKFENKKIYIRTVILEGSGTCTVLYYIGYLY